VRHTELPQSGGSQSAAPDVTYEDVRQSFLVRLHGEYTRLKDLTAALESAVLAPAPSPSLVFVELEAFAHRLRGAAAVFDFPELRDAAKALELAANEAVVERAVADDSRVEAAIRLLRARLACLTEATSSSDPLSEPTN
jgi:HPt (histidine-containing phosphotransfer) domain-containing protein